MSDDGADAGPRALPPRDPEGHKGTFGTVLVVGGSVSAVRTVDGDLSPAMTMLGAPVLAARGAIRSGAGLVRAAVPGPLAIEVVRTLPEATAIGLEIDADGTLVPHAAARVLDAAFASATAAVVGPGLGVNEGAAAVVLRAIGQEDVPVVLDADGLSALASLAAAGDIARDVRAPLVLTPHPGEFARLCAALGVPGLGERATGDDAARRAAAEGLAQRLGCVVVLKGAGTVVSDALRTWVCDGGHHCLATGGTGDVLAGVIGGLIAQFVGRADEAGPWGGRAIGGMVMPLPPGRVELFDVACRGVEAHATAGKAWACAHGGVCAAGLLASELADLVPAALAAT